MHCFTRSRLRSPFFHGARGFALHVCNSLCFSHCARAICGSDFSLQLSEEMLHLLRHVPSTDDNHHSFAFIPFRRLSKCRQRHSCGAFDHPFLGTMEKEYRIHNLFFGDEHAGIDHLRHTPSVIVSDSSPPAVLSESVGFSSTGTIRPAFMAS